jgi:hypothetical protein
MVSRAHGCALSALCILLAGCGATPPAEFPQIAPDPEPYVPKVQSENAFDIYALAALEIEEKSGSQISWVSFAPSDRRKLIHLTSPAIERIRKAGRLPCRFQFVPSRPFEAPPYQRGWRMAGRVLVWRIQSAIADEQWDVAIADTLLATRFGFDLTGGGALDASLGFQIVDEARRALAPALHRLGAGQLATFAKALSAILARRPALEQTIRNEQRVMQLAIQDLQDRYQSKQLDKVRAKLGPDIREAISYLEDLRAKDATERPKYFTGFLRESDAEVRWLLDTAELPASRRSKQPELAEFRPWRRFARHFLQTARPILAVNDVTTAQTRLLILESQLMRLAKSGQPLPKSLGAYTRDVTTDPFSGNAFIYRAQGTQFYVYSVGEDNRDDGGATDETYQSPDLRLERSPY